MLNGNSLYTLETGRRTVLVADDDQAVRKLLKINLERSGFSILEADNGEDALELALEARPDLVILDVLMPGRNGTDVLRELRQSSNVPVILATTESAVVDRVVGLEMGADDFVTKPFSPREMVARVQAVLRRASDCEPTEIDAGEIRLDLERYMVQRNGTDPIQLTMKEFQLLRTLVTVPGKVFTREELLKNVWGCEDVGDTRTLDFHVRRLRGKIEENPSSPRLLRTVYGVGYKFSA